MICLDFPNNTLNPHVIRWQEEHRRLHRRVVKIWAQGAARAVGMTGYNIFSAHSK